MSDICLDPPTEQELHHNGVECSIESSIYLIFLLFLFYQAY